MTENDHHSPGARDQGGPTDPYAAPPASLGAPTPWSAPAAYGSPPAAYGPPPPAGPQQWSGYPTPYAADPNRAPEPRTMNTWSIVALVTGILPLGPVAIGAGITALVQLNRRKQSGRSFAIVGLVLGAFWITFAAGLGVLAATDGLASATDAGTGTASDGVLGRIADAGSTTVGDCLREPTEQDSVATKIACSASHFGEVYRTLDLTGTRWPGYDNIAQRADDMCLAEFKGYVGTSYEESNFEYFYYLPDQAEWLAGEHRAVCVLLPGDTDTSRGSARDSRD